MKISTPYECVPLQKVVYFQEGPGLRNWQYGNSGVPFLNIRTLTDEGYINKSLCQFVKQEEFEDKYEHFLLDAGDYVVSSSGTLGKLAEVRCEDLPLMLNTSVIRFRPLDDAYLDRTFLKWFIKSPLYIRQIEKASTGTAIKNYGPSHLKKMVIPLPPLEEQKRIAAILDKADGIRRKRKKAIALTEELLRSTFLDMFGDPVTNPKGWKVDLFGNVGVLNRGKSKHRPRNDPSLLNGKYPLIQTGDIANCKEIIETYTQTYSEKGLAQSRMWDAGTLCITIAANIAKTGILGFDACFPDSVVGFQPNEKTNNEYIQGWLQFLQPVLEDRAPQSAQKNINLDILRKLDLPVPPIELQQKFSAFTQKVRDSAKKNEGNEVLLDNLFNALLQKAFCGEL